MIRQRQAHGCVSRVEVVGDHTFDADDMSFFATLILGCSELDSQRMELVKTMIAQSMEKALDRGLLG